MFTFLEFSEPKEVCVSHTLGLCDLEDPGLGTIVLRSSSIHSGERIIFLFTLRLMF